MDNTTKVMLVFILSSIIIGAVGQIALKKGVDAVSGKFSVMDILNPWNLPKIFIQSPWVLAGMLAYIAGFFIWIAALSKFNVSFMYPLLGLSYVLVAVMAFVFLKENITIVRWLGIVLITVGSFLLLKSA